MKLYSIHYKGDDQNPRVFEGVTDNFKKWLEEHNKNKVKQNCQDDDDFPEDWQDDADDFEVEEINLYLYNKEK